MVGSENGIVGAKTGEFLQNLSPRPVPPASFNTTWSKQMCESKIYVKSSGGKCQTVVKRIYKGSVSCANQGEVSLKLKVESYKRGIA